MNEIEYIGEHLLPGQIGRFTIILGFVASLLATVAYFFAEKKKETSEGASWLKIGRVGFWIHAVSVLTTIGCILFVLYHRMYEYHYAFLHTSDDLEMKYILSAFWEGQEGSFLLWMFWHVILGLILIRVAKSWEAPVMSVLSLVQLGIGSMILGVYLIGETKIGVNPLVMFRDTIDIPLFNQADYLEQLNGQGLNPLLQNYWMTIHPPTLFLGFASTTIPFCFAIAGLWNGRHKDMLKVAFPWALFSAGILGIGILMGGAWAYEALSFGGYWAWDPVENASLVPWIILIAGIHTHLIAKATGYSYRSTYLFYILTFFFILYSTFLTRSGILGDTSVHAFTEMGLYTQLLIFTLFFLFFPIGVFIYKWGTIPVIDKEENTPSKEFWMFIGSLVLIFSAGLITAFTSLPVYNKIYEVFDPTFDGMVIKDPVSFNNKYQLWIAVFIGIFSGVAQYLRFKEGEMSKEASKYATYLGGVFLAIIGIPALIEYFSDISMNWKFHWLGLYAASIGLYFTQKNWSGITKKIFLHLNIAIAITLIATYLTLGWITTSAWQYQLLLGSGIFAIVTNLDYLITYIKGNLKIAGSAISHIGFGLMIVGILASGLNKEHISKDPFKYRGILNEEMAGKNVILTKGVPEVFNGYKVTYQKDTLIDRFMTFDINFKKLGKNREVIEEFDVHPTAQFDNKLMKIASYNPDTKHYLHKDIFTHVATLPVKVADREKAREIEDSLNYRMHDLPMLESFSFNDTIEVDADSFVINTFHVQLEDIILQGGHPDYNRKDGDFTIGANLKIRINDKDKVYEASPMILERNELYFPYPTQINDIATKVRLPLEFIKTVFDPYPGRFDFRSFDMKIGDTLNFQGHQIKLLDVSRNPKNPLYKTEANDVAAAAVLSISGKDDIQPTLVQPVFVIKNGKASSEKVDFIKDQSFKHGLHFQFVKLDPNTSTFTIAIAHEGRVSYPVEIANDSLRSDYIVFEAIIFPGINFFWIGTIMMMLGLMMSWLRRRWENQKSIGN